MNHNTCEMNIMVHSICEMNVMSHKALLDPDSELSHLWFTLSQLDELGQHGKLTWNGNLGHPRFTLTEFKDLDPKMVHV